MMNFLLQKWHIILLRDKKLLLKYWIKEKLNIWKWQKKCDEKLIFLKCVHILILLDCKQLQFNYILFHYLCLNFVFVYLIYIATKSLILLQTSLWSWNTSLVANFSIILYHEVVYHQTKLDTFFIRFANYIHYLTK